MEAHTDDDVWAGAIADYAAHLVTGARSPRTIRKRCYWISRFGAEVGAGPWEVTPLEVTRWAARHDWAPETRRSVRSSLTTFYRWAIDAGLATSSPARILPPVKPPRAVPRPAPDDVTAAALAGASTRDRMIVQLAALAGLRRAEIAAVRWEWVTDDRIQVTGKGGHQRLVPAHADLRATLGEVRRARAAGGLEDGWRYTVDPASPWVLPGIRHPHMSEESVGAVLKRRLGPDWSGHTLRARFATRGYRGTRDIRAIQELLGHASLVTTQRYVGVEWSDLEQAVAAAA